jgi:hypothetical protein
MIGSTQVNPTQGPQMPSEVGQLSDLSAAIAGITTLAILALGTLAWRRVATWLTDAGADLKATRSQTTNGHKTNLRDDVTAIGDDLATLTKNVGSIIGEIRELRDDVRFVLRYTRTVDERLIRHLGHQKQEDNE